MQQATAISTTLAQEFKQNSGKIRATLIRLLGDLDLAEEALQEAFSVALEAWSEQGIPYNPSAWLISTARFKAIDIIRRRAKFGELAPELQRLSEDLHEHNAALAQQDIEDDQLRLIFLCCHPAIDPKVQVPLTLREVCGLSTEEIAAAFLTTTPTMAQRIVRGKAKIRKANIPFNLPAGKALTERLDSVLAVIYLVFNEGYSASAGDSLTRKELSGEAIRLARLVAHLLPDPEVSGLLALMLLHESRRQARVDAQGDIILLEDQDRSLWDKAAIAEGQSLVQSALASGRFGTYTLQAAISAVHAEAASAEVTDWPQIVALYSVLQRVSPSPVVELNRAVAVAMRDGPAAGLGLVEAIQTRGDLLDYHLLHATYGELLRRDDQPLKALKAFERALELCKQEAERRFLRGRISQLRSQLA